MRPFTFRSVVPWVLAWGLLLVWAFGVVTSNNLGGAAEGALIAGAVMVFVSLVLGRRGRP